MSPIQRANRHSVEIRRKRSNHHSAESHSLSEKSLPSPVGATGRAHSKYAVVPVVSARLHAQIRIIRIVT